MMTLDTFQHRYGRWAAPLLLALLCFLLCAQGAAAQDSGAATSGVTGTVTGTVTAPQVTTDPVSGDPAAAGPAAAGVVTNNDVNEVARQLWCPLCSGVRLDACELKACSQMKDVIGQKLAGGEDAASIKDYFVAQYGPQVLGEPPLEGFNWLAWILPVIALAAGGLFIVNRVRTSTRRTETLAPAPPPTAGDAYSRKLDEELKNYE